MGKSFFRWTAGLIFAAMFAVPPALAQPEAYSQQQLESMLAPIALYPDELLSQVLIAATYPDDVADAADFLDRNPDLTGDELADAVAGQPWDDSVKALTQFPSLIAMLDDQPDWADAIGYAFVYQQGDVMAAVQRLRESARDAGMLASNAQQRVVVQNTYIYIEPARPGYFYVPYYDPLVVYGSWRWPNYPPYYWSPPPRYRPPHYSVANGIFFGLGVGIVSSIFRPARPDWRLHHVVIGGHGRPGTIWHHRPRPNRPGVRPPSNRPHRPGLPSKPPAWKPPAHRPPSQGVRPPRPGKPGGPSVRPPATVQPGKPVRPERPGQPGIKPAPNLPMRPVTRPPHPPVTVNPKPMPSRPETGTRPTTMRPNRPSPSAPPSPSPSLRPVPQTRPSGAVQPRPVMPPQAKPQAPVQARPQRPEQTAPSRPAAKPEGRGQERRNDNGKRERRGNQP